MGATTPTAKPAQGGFTLVEILVALVILSFVALGIAGLFSHAITVNASGHDYALLATEARFALESLQALPFTDANLAETTEPRSWTPANPDFQIRFTVQDFYVDNWTNVENGNWAAPTAELPANLKRITLTVESTNQILEGRRIFTVSSLKIPE
jgi:prepilin-type N-terminal cleavage/methylation domain-containing protein